MGYHFLPDPYSALLFSGTWKEWKTTNSCLFQGSFKHRTSHYKAFQNTGWFVILLNLWSAGWGHIYLGVGAGGGDKIFFGTNPIFGAGGGGVESDWWDPKSFPVTRPASSYFSLSLLGGQSYFTSIHALQDFLDQFPTTQWPFLSMVIFICCSLSFSFFVGMTFFISSSRFSTWLL